MILANRLRILVIAAVLCCAAGCTMTPRLCWVWLKGEGFTGWSDGLASGVRGNRDARPSDYFTDRKSEQIEKDLGGDF
jgi:hypothetical protein